MSCGHEHEHEHAHEPVRGQGHDHHHHDHHEETVETPWGTVRLEAHTHEQAATVSMALCPAAGKAMAFGSVVELMRQVAERAEAAGGIVGHVKAFARQGDAFAHASVTAAYLEPAVEGDASLGYGERADIQLVAIVLLVSQDELVSICREALIELAPS